MSNLLSDAVGFLCGCELSTCVSYICTDANIREPNAQHVPCNNVVWISNITLKFWFDSHRYYGCMHIRCNWFLSVNKI